MTPPAAATPGQYRAQTGTVLAGASIRRHLDAGVQDWTVGQLTRWALRTATRAELARAAGCSVYMVDKLRRIFPPGA